MRPRAAIAAALLVAGCASAGGAPDVRTHPRWEELAHFAGTGTAAREVTIVTTALQWRAGWRCTGDGTLRVEATPTADRSGNPLVDAACPGDGFAFAATSGTVALAVSARADWELAVAAQVDTPLVEPPLPAMTAPGSAVIARGSFRDLERSGSGRALLYRLADGQTALRLAGFETAPTADLVIWLSESASVDSGEEAVTVPHVELGELRATAGSQNYLLPNDVDPARVRSVVIWCTPLRIAYAAAPLERA